MDWTTNDIINMMLKQLGATSVKTVHANITVAKFEIEDYKMSYMYDIILWMRRLNLLIRYV